MNTERAVPFTLWEITRVERGATIDVVVRPITVTSVSADAKIVSFTDADGTAGSGYFSYFYDTEAEALADLEASA